MIHYVALAPFMLLDAIALRQFQWLPDYSSLGIPALMIFLLTMPSRGMSFTRPDYCSNRFIKIPLNCFFIYGDLKGHGGVGAGGWPSSCGFSLV